jgi:flagellar motor switch/type III secretory pathway protein FliN
VNIRPYKLINRSESEALTTRLTGAVGHWSDAYAAGDLAVDCVLLSAVEIADRMPLVEEWLIGASGRGPVLAIGLASNWQQRLLGWLLGKPPAAARVETGTLARELCGLALQNLGRRIVESVSGATSGLGWSPGQQPMGVRAECGFVVASFRIGADTSLLVVLWPDTVHASVSPPPNRRVAAPAVEPLSRALQNEVVVLCARVGGAELAVDELTTLSVGDVIRLDRKINEPLDVYVEGGSRVCAARLGSHHGRKALQLT